MPVTLAQLTHNRASVTIKIDAENSVTIWYYPGRITEKVFAQIQDFSSMAESDVMAQFSALNEIIERIVATWDVLDNDGSTFPVEANRLAELPIGFRLQVIDAIIRDIRPELIAPQIQASNGSY